MQVLQTLQNWISGKEVLILVLVLVVGMTLYGHNRGLVRMLVSAASILISLFVVNLLLPFAEAQLQNSAGIQAYTKAWSEKLLSEQLSTDSASPIYQLLGLDRVAENLGEYLAGFAIRILCFVVLFLIVSFVVKLLAHVLNVMTKIPIICGMNQLGGAFVGCAEGVFYVWLLMLIVTCMPGLAFSQEAIRQIGDNALLTLIYEHNFIIRFFAGMLLGGAG